MGLNPTILRQGRAFSWVLTPAPSPLARRPYRASGLVPGRTFAVQIAQVYDRSPSHLRRSRSRSAASAIRRTPAVRRRDQTPSELAAFAEAERDRIRERIGQVKADQKARGRYLCGKVPFGFRRGDDGELERNPIILYRAHNHRI